MIIILFIVSSIVGISTGISFNYLNNDNIYNIVPITSKNLRLIDLDASKPLKILIHGWEETADKHYYNLISLSYFIKGFYNIIQVDWSELAARSYPRSSRETFNVGIKLGELIYRLHTEKKVPLDSVHIIGHSLGAQIASYTGKYISKVTNGSLVGRITGLDPASFLFQFPVSINGPRALLTSTDATAVDILHTDGGFIGYNGDDRNGAIGTVDFYANSGLRPQPPCAHINLLVYGPWETFFCAHQIGIQYFVEAINSNNFVAVKCNSYDNFKSGRCNGNKKVIYGENLPKNLSGSYYFQTNEHRPYSQGNLNSLQTI